MGLLPNVPEPEPKRPSDRKQLAGEIRVILRSLLLPEYRSVVSKEKWVPLLDRYQQDFPDLVQKIRTRIERSISEHKETYAIHQQRRSRIS
jgi:hypothetical protein